MNTLQIKGYDYAGTKRGLSVWMTLAKDPLHPNAAVTVSVDNSVGNFMGIVILNEDQLRELHEYTGKALAAIEEERS